MSDVEDAQPGEESCRSPALAAISAAESVPQWALAYLQTTSLTDKTTPPSPPDDWRPHSYRAPSKPGRPDKLNSAKSKNRKNRRGTLSEPVQRARLLHTFWHHELQAAELMCWALLKFSDTELSFRKGLLGICQDEIRHMRLYQERIESLGFELGSFPVRDWFWERVPTCKTPLSFVAMMGLGLEAANLEHAKRFAAEFRLAGDLQSAAIQEQIGEEETAHVHFAVSWYERWAGPLDFERWQEALPPPLSPLLMRGLPINHSARAAAGMNSDFLKKLQRWRPEPTPAKTKQPKYE